MTRPMFYHDLQCKSGIGDRLLDLWAAVTVARLHDPGGAIEVHWRGGLRFAGFTGDYSTESFSVPNCRFVVVPRTGAVDMDAGFSHDAFNPHGLFRLADGVWQIVLRTGRIWGSAYPHSLHADRAFHALDASLPLDAVLDAHRAVRTGTAPAALIGELVPDDIAFRVGVHARLQDKCVPIESSTDMSVGTWQRIERASLNHLDDCIARGLPLFLCSDDGSYKAALERRLRARGADVISTHADAVRSLAPGAAAVLDFFSLCGCREVVQMTKYSTFSLAAALAGEVPLVNFYDGTSGAGTRLDIWRPLLLPRREADVH